MKCPHCSFDNRDDAAFCENCGEVFVAASAKVSVPPVVEVPPVVRVPDVAPAPSKPAPRASVADLVDPVPDGPDVPDLSGFERLVDSSYVPPAATQAGDTAEIPRINEEYVPRARSYAMGPTEKELRRRDRQQKKLAKKFSKMQEKEEARKAKELLRAEKERLRAETAAEKERLRAAEAEAREQRRIAEEEAREARRAAEAAEREERERLEQERAAAATAAAAVAAETAEMEEAPEFTTPGEDAPVAENETSKAGDASGVAFGAIPGAVAGFAAADATAKDDDLDEVLSSGDEVVSLFERSGKRPARMGSHAARPSVNRQGRGRSRKTQDEAGATPETPVVQEAPQASPNESADACAAEETALMEAASAIVVADQAAVTTAEAEEALTPRATGELAFPSTIEEETPELESSIDFSAPEEAAPVRDGADTEAPFPGPSARPPRAKGPIIAAACIALAVVLAAVAGGTYMAELWGGKTIPEVVGLSQPEAVDALTAKGFVAQAVEVKSDDPQGTVLSSDPEQGHRAEEGSTVTLSVAVPRIVPAIVGATSEEAAQALEAEGFTAVTYTEEKSNEAAGTVLAVSPEAGTEAKSGDAITVTVAVPYTVPDVEGMSEADAKAALQAEGYEVTSEWYTTEDIEEGTAVSTDPAAGSELNSGSEVTLYVAHSRGTELVDLTREILPGANLTNDEGSFKVENIKSCTYRGDGEVLYTVEARQYEVVTMPFGLGQETVFAKKLTTIEGGIVWNDDNEVSYASPSYSLRALVLRRTKLGESDLILTLLSEDGSQKRAVAKGARRPKSSFAARTEPFCVIDALCATGRSLDILKEARLVAAHDALRCNLEASAAAAPVAELLARMSQRDLANPRLFQSAMRVLDAMDGADDSHRAALSAAELLKILAFSGLRPSLEVCVGCGEPVALVEGARIPFSAAGGGVLCESCRGLDESVLVDAGTLCWAQYFLTTPFDAIAEGPVDLTGTFAVLHLVQDLVRAHIGSSLKSLEFLFTCGLF